MTKEQQIVKKHRKIIYGIVAGLIILFSCTTFPFYNFTHEWSGTIKYMNIAISISAFVFMGTTEASIFKEKTVMKILLLNTLLVIIGMGCRYLLEFGEVSNTYNFAVLNSLVHIVVIVIISTLSWYRVVCKSGENTNENKLY